MPYYFLHEDAAKNPHTLPNVWITHLDVEEMREAFPDDEDHIPGFVWCFCIPGCLPDSDWCGPFPSEEAALDNARLLYGD